MNRNVYSEEDFLQLSGIQHFAFCPRQWGLIHLEQQWAENLFTTEGHFLHEKVDNPYIFETRGICIVARAVPIVSYRLGLSGKADVIEYLFVEDSGNAVELEGHCGYWRPFPVEYKRGRPKQDDRDAVQLCAQAMCLEEMHGIRIENGYIYYGQIRHRISVDFNMVLRSRVEELTQKMHEIFLKGETPSVPAGANCKLCSLVDLCMPKLSRKKKSASHYIAKNLASLRFETQ